MFFKKFHLQNLASKLYGVFATIKNFVFVLYFPSMICTLLCSEITLKLFSHI